MSKGKYLEWIKEDGLLKLSAWARDGLTDDQISDNIGITRSTLSEWKNRFPDIADALKKGKEIADIHVENALYKKACGYSYIETVRERLTDSGQKARHGGDVQYTEKEWQFAMMYFNFKCAYCGERMQNLTKDHVIPLIKGGKLERKNVVPACQSCNSSKKDEDMERWFQKQTFYEKQRMDKIKDYIEFVSELSDDIYGQMVITKEITKEVQPDTTAAIFWLKNRKPDVWRDKHELSGNHKITNGDFTLEIKPSDEDAEDQS